MDKNDIFRGFYFFFFLNPDARYLHTKVQNLQGCVVCVCDIQMNFQILKLHMFLYLHIHNWSLHPFSQDYELSSHTTYVVCVNLIHSQRDLQFKVESERQIFWETFHAKFIYSPNFCQKSAERKSRKKYFYFTSNRPTHYQLDYGDFVCVCMHAFVRT